MDSLSRVRQRAAVLVLLGAALLVPAGTWAQSTRGPARVDAAALRSLDGYITQAMRDWNVPGLAIAIVAGDSVVFAKGYGVQSVDTREPVNTGTRFAIGSTTKAIISTALGILVDEGKVEWDAPVITYLPWFRVADPYITREITVRDLLTHRAGFPNIDQIWTSTNFTADEILRRISELEAVYSLRSGFIYQNVMYAVAGAVIEAASGTSWDDFVRARILQPLGMNATEPLLAGVTGQPNVASPHASAGGTLRVGRNTPVDPVGPAGSIWSSIDDMAKWTRFNLNGGELNGVRLVREETMREILSPHVIAPKSMYPTMNLVQPRFFTYGLAWFLHDYDGEAVAMHTGSISGMNALIGLLPDRGVGMYVLLNTGGAELRHALMYRVFDLFSGRPERDWSRELLALYRSPAQQAGQGQQATQVSLTGPASAPASLPLERYAGRYVAPVFGAVTVTHRDGELHFTSELGRAGTLRHTRFDTFLATWSDGSGSTNVVFMPDGAGGVAALRALGRVFERAAERR